MPAASRARVTRRADLDSLSGMLLGRDRVEDLRYSFGSADDRAVTAGQLDRLDPQPLAGGPALPSRGDRPVFRANDVAGRNSGPRRERAGFVHRASGIEEDARRKRPLQTLGRAVVEDGVESDFRLSRVLADPGGIHHRGIGLKLLPQAPAGARN